MRSLCMVYAAVGMVSLSIAAEDVQSAMNTHDDRGWRVSVSDDWDVLGPFPTHAREQHFLSPSYPLNLTEPVDFTTQWPSSYADQGKVGWTRALSNEGKLVVSFPDIRWASLRATEGWAALQHHAVLRTVLTLYPPAGPATNKTSPSLLVRLSQGSFFTILPPDDSPSRSDIPTWYSGDIYAIGKDMPQAVTLPTPPSDTSPSTYQLFVSGDYEIRLFGDPATQHEDVPRLCVSVSIELEDDIVRRPLYIPSHNVIPDFSDGWAFGDAIGIAIRSPSDWLTINQVSLSEGSPEGISLELLQETRIAPTQIRMVPLKITQNVPISESNLFIRLSAFSSSSISVEIPIVLPLRHHSGWHVGDITPITASYFFALSIPTAFLAVPPLEHNQGRPLPPLLALHGAGVDVIDQPFWAKAIPRQRYSWVIIPTGRTSWGLDWHGPSAHDAWSTVDALTFIICQRAIWSSWEIADKTQVLILGHSNGGQGTWYMASRFPDRVVGAVPAAAYIKSQSYVPLTQSRSAHFIDPTLRAILETSLTPDDNDLFLSNLVNTPILAIHGGTDDNVPVWHTREAISILKTWRSDVNITLREDPGQPHWYPTVFDNHQVRDYISSLLTQGNAQSADLPSSNTFTLTVAIPAESGSLHGWRIEALRIPGRLARLTVGQDDTAVILKTKNVLAFSFQAPRPHRHLEIDGQQLSITHGEGDETIFMMERGRWQATSRQSIPMQPSGRMLRILTTCAPLTLIIPTADPSDPLLSIALRIAHDLYLYHRLDAEIVNASEALRRLDNQSIGSGNLVVLGDARNLYTQHILRQKRTAFRLDIDQQTLLLEDRPIDDTSVALFLHPHPTNAKGLTLFIYSNHAHDLERGRRLFPIRTGVAIPDWIVVGRNADQVAAGGVEGAGVWGYNWTRNEHMSSF